MPPSAASRALSAGLGVLDSQFARVFTVGAVTFKGITKEPLVASRGVPRGLSFGQEHDFEIRAQRSYFTGALPKPGSTITGDGIKYRVVGVQEAPGSHVITFLCVQPAR